MGVGCTEHPAQDAKEEERIGLVKRVAPASELDSVVRDIAEKLAAKSPGILVWNLIVFGYSARASFSSDSSLRI
jgi:enoyl-CoA hydratase/carnithine racemase